MFPISLYILETVHWCWQLNQVKLVYFGKCKIKHYYLQCAIIRGSLVCVEVEQQPNSESTECIFDYSIKSDGLN